ncbi:Hypothetical predicted protein [Octopus vulgaris]|uniref:Uncharacterized protein n=1 Tax=Octopus vulgaris TaxID=6645 RepID=A0AA36F886_OCTVU|nr:Hypothetical predicted protein [Octopus vulgaris]
MDPVSYLPFKEKNENQSKWRITGGKRLLDCRLYGSRHKIAPGCKKKQQGELVCDQLRNIDSCTTRKHREGPGPSAAA